METKKISELTEVTSPSGTDVFPIVNNGETKKLQLTNCKEVLGINGIDTRLSTVETNQGTLANLTTTEKTNLVGAINELDDTRAKILWTNPNPTNSFSPQTITLNSDDYDVYDVFVANAPGQETLTGFRGVKGHGVISVIFGGSTITMRIRDFIYASNTSFSVSDGKIYSALGTATYTTNNSMVIPIYIVGYKTGLL